MDSFVKWGRLSLSKLWLWRLISRPWSPAIAFFPFFGCGWPQVEGHRKLQASHRTPPAHLTCLLSSASQKKCLFRERKLFCGVSLSPLPVPWRHRLFGLITACPGRRSGRPRPALKAKGAWIPPSSGRNGIFRSVCSHARGCCRAVKVDVSELRSFLRCVPRVFHSYEQQGCVSDPVDKWCLSFFHNVCFP